MKLRGELRPLIDTEAPYLVLSGIMSTCYYSLVEMLTELRYEGFVFGWFWKISYWWAVAFVTEFGMLPFLLD